MSAQLRRPPSYDDHPTENKFQKIAEYLKITMTFPTWQKTAKISE